MTNVRVFTAEDFTTILPNGERICTIWNHAAADIANRLLAERAAPVYSGWWNNAKGVTNTDMWSTTFWPHDKATHTALLINVQPIANDTLEGVLRDWLAFEDASIAKEGPYVGEAITLLIERARKVLGTK